LERVARRLRQAHGAVRGVILTDRFRAAAARSAATTSTLMTTAFLR